MERAGHRRRVSTRGAGPGEGGRATESHRPQTRGDRGKAPGSLPLPRLIQGCPASHASPRLNSGLVKCWGCHHRPLNGDEDRACPPWTGCHRRRTQSHHGAVHTAAAVTGLAFQCEVTQVPTRVPGPWGRGPRGGSGVTVLGLWAQRVGTHVPSPFSAWSPTRDVGHRLVFCAPASAGVR